MSAAALGGGDAVGDAVLELDPFGQESARRVLRVAKGANQRLHRCVGLEAEADNYLRGGDEPGWSIQGRPTAGDVLVGVTGRGARHRVVSVTKVVGVTRSGDCLWDEATDAPLAPGVPWKDVERELSSPVPRSWTTVEGAQAQALLTAVVAAVRSQRVVTASEGERRLQQCRDRSRANRKAALNVAAGRCQGCEVDLRSLFGGLSVRALEVHHKEPLGGRPEGRVKTRMTDLVVLCATCHRLLHADPTLDMARLRDRWLGLA